MDPTSPSQSDRFLLWIDAVGGYWVCTGDEIVLGQPLRPDAVDVPILGDLSSRHARIRRDGEGYVIDALRDVWVQDKQVAGTAALRDGHEIRLGSGVRLAFRLPHALSATARLDFLSRHRTHPSADAILLMADSFVLGPRPHSHVVCRKWREDVIVYRHDNDLFCRSLGDLEIDGHAHHNKGPLTRGSRVAGDCFAFCLESV